MRLFAWIYVNLKQMIKQFPITILYMIGLPLIIGILMGNMMDMLFENPNNMDPITIQVIDEDQSTLSHQLISMLSDESLEAYVLMADQDFSATLTIPSGYENELLNQRNSGLTLTEVTTNPHEISLTVLQQLLDQYHEQLMIQLSAQSSEALNVIYNQSTLQTNYVDTPLQLNSQTYYSVSMLTFFICMMILTITASGYKSAELGLNKRFAAVPLTKLIMFNYDFIGNCIYTALLILIYVFVYRLLGYSFTGSLSLLIILSLATSFFIVSIGLFISNFFSSKYGNLIAYLLFFVQIILGGTFLPMDNFPPISPSYFISQMFENYVLFGTWQSVQFPLLITLAIAAIFYLLTVLKEKYHWWGA